MDVVPIKVKIGLRPNGHADHPDWTQLQYVQEQATLQGIDPKDYKGGVGGWQYDKTSGHQDETAGSPYGEQWGMALVWPDIAQQALAAWPAKVFLLTEVEAEDFWDNKAHGHTPELKRDEKALRALQAELELRQSVGQFTTGVEEDIRDALDPDKRAPGVCRDPLARWQTAKVKLGFTAVTV